MVESILQNKLVLDTLGKIEYDIIDCNKALVNIMVYVDGAKFKDLLKRRKIERKVFIVVDKSGSMSGGNINAARSGA